MTQSSPRVLIVFSTSSGCTESIARRIGTDIIAHGGRPKVMNVTENPIIDETVDAVIAGSGVRVGKWHRDMLDWVRDNKDQLNTIPFAVFSVGIMSVGGDPAKVRQAQADLAKNRRIFFSAHANRECGFHRMEGVRTIFSNGAARAQGTSARRG